MTNIKECKQIKCTFQKGRPLELMCPACTCGAEPHLIDEDCTNCWNCLKDEGFIRKGEPEQKKKKEKEKKEKELIVEC